MAEQQLELEGIGQQKYTLAMWKKENKIYTHLADHMEDDRRWSCWDEFESPLDFGEKYSYDAMAVAGTEKKAIEKFCDENDIKLPFWWK